MSFDKLSGLPDWNDDDFSKHGDEGEGWKPNPTKKACKAMYEQWKQVMVVLKGALESAPPVRDADTGDEGFPEAYWEEHKAMILGDGLQVAVKIKSSEAGLYTIRMENASIIRLNAQFIKSSMLTMMGDRAIEEAHGKVIREEIDKFRLLFRQWVSTFVRDEFEDEWGLF